MRRKSDLNKRKKKKAKRFNKNKMRKQKTIGIKCYRIKKKKNLRQSSEEMA